MGGKIGKDYLVKLHWGPCCGTTLPPIPSLGPLCDIPSGCYFFTGPCTVTCCSLHVLCQALLPTPLLVQALHHMPRPVSMCVRPNCSTPPHVVLVVYHQPPHAAMCVGPNYSIRARGARGRCAHLHGFRRCVRTSADGVHSFMVDVGGVCTSAVAWVVCTTTWSLVRPTPVLSSIPSLSSTILRTRQTALQGSLRWASGRGVPCAHNQDPSSPARQTPQEPH